MGDNGNPNPETQLEKKTLLSISIDKEKKIYVTGVLQNPSLCYHLLAEAIKIITDYKPKVIKPDLPIVSQMLNFARSLKK